MYEEDAYFLVNSSVWNDSQKHHTSATICVVLYQLTTIKLALLSNQARKVKWF